MTCNIITDCAQMKFFKAIIIVELLFSYNRKLVSPEIKNVYRA